MKLNHVAINIQSKEELIDFYQNILGFNFEYQFNMPAELADTIFELKKKVDVFLYKREDIFFELFIHSENTNPGFAHICIGITNRESIAAKCEQSGYPLIRINRSDKHDILFVKDKAGNIFELKEGA